MIFINAAHRPKYAAETSSREPMEFHKRFAEYAPTPLHSLDALAKELGVGRIYLKDESSRLGLPAFKILGASWATCCVLSERYPELVNKGDGMQSIAEAIRGISLTLYSATDGNHGRAVARVAKLLGLGAHIYVPLGTVPARINAIEKEGATVTIVDGTYDDTVDRAASDGNKDGGILIQDNGWEGYVDIPRRIIEGYSTMLWEIEHDFASAQLEPPTHVIVQIGVGSFAEAVIRHYGQAELRPLILGVEPLSTACALESVKAGKVISIPGPHKSIMAGMNCDSPSLVSLPVMQSAIKAFIAIRDDRAREAMRLLARFGIESGETGAAGLGALLELLSKEGADERGKLDIGPASRILLFSTEGVTDPVSYRSITGGS